MSKQSEENRFAVEVYSNPEYAEAYVRGGELKAAAEPEHQSEKFNKWVDFFVGSMEDIPDGKRLEVAAGDAPFYGALKERGFCVTESDASPAFVEIMKDTGIEDAFVFNVLKDDFPDTYSAVLAWRALVHFSPEDIETTLSRIYDALKEGGRFIFNAFNRKPDDPKFKAIDFDGPYHMGVERPYFFYTEQEINEMIQKIGFKIHSFHKEGKEDKWLVYVLEKNNRIDKFRKEYFFLSNFYPCLVTYQGITYQSSEAAYQAQKTLDESIRKEFSKLDADSSKKAGRELELRPDWDEVKLEVMYEICKAKFTQNRELTTLLLETGNRKLIEGNDWDDKFWGVCDGEGENHLGKILMKIRQELE